MSWLKSQWEEQTSALRDLWRNKRKLSFQVLNLLMIVCSALMIWKFFVVMTNGSMEPAFRRGDILFLSNREPMVNVGDIVVFKVAGRDIPIVHRVLKVHRGNEDEGITYDAINFEGDWSPHEFENAFEYGMDAFGKVTVGIADSLLGNTGEETRVKEALAKKELYLTKGDNNPVDDRNLYAADQVWLRREEVVGKAVFSLPYLGFMTILLNDYPIVKFLLLGGMAFFALTGKE